MGVDTRYLSQNKELLIVNGLNPEPGITWAEPMLETHVRNLRSGLALLRAYAAPGASSLRSRPA